MQEVVLRTKYVDSLYLRRRGVTCVEVYPGLGKTKAAWKEALLLEDNIVYIAPLRSLVRAQQEQIRDAGRPVIYYETDHTWQNYLHPASETKGYIICITPYQLTHIMEKGCRKDLTIIIDEITLVFQMLVMASFMNHRVWRVLQVLQFMLKECNIVYILDALFPACIMRWIREHARSIRHIQIAPTYFNVQNIHSLWEDRGYRVYMDESGEWHSYDVENDVSRNIYASSISPFPAVKRLYGLPLVYRESRQVEVTCEVERWTRQLFCDIAAGERIFICCSSASKASCLKNIIEAEYPTKRIFLATAKQLHKLTEEDPVFEIVTEMEKPEWNVIIATGCVWTGISLEQTHWTRVYAFYDERGGSILDLFQGLARCRCLLNGESIAKVCLVNEKNSELTLEDVEEQTKLDLIHHYSRIGNQYLPECLMRSNFNEYGLEIDWNNTYTAIVLFFHTIKRQSELIPAKLMEVYERSYYYSISFGNMRIDNSASLLGKKGLLRSGLSLQQRIEFYSNQQFQPHGIIHQLNPLTRFLLTSGLDDPGQYVEIAKRFLPHAVNINQPAWSASLMYVYDALARRPRVDLNEIIDLYAELEEGGEPVDLPYPNRDEPIHFPIVVASPVYTLVSSFVGTRTLCANRCKYLFRLAHLIYPTIPREITAQYLERGYELFHDTHRTTYEQAYHLHSYLPQMKPLPSNQHRKKQRWFAKVLLVFTNRFIIFPKRSTSRPREDMEIKMFANSLYLSSTNRKIVHFP